MISDNSINQVDGGLTNLVPLNSAIEKNDFNLLNELIQKGAHPDGMDETSFTPLMEAAQNRNFPAVKALLEAGANVNRLGFIQRYYPLDFAYAAQPNDEVIKLLESKGALKVDSDINWEQQAGIEIIAHVSRNYAAVYPTPFKIRIQEKEIYLWAAQIRARKDLLYVFSSNLHEVSGIRLNIGMVVPSEWSLLENYLTKNSIFSFPFDIIKAVCARVLNGNPLSEGDLISSKEDDTIGLKWPESISALLAVDQLWSGDSQAEAPATTDEVIIYTLAPVTQKTARSKKFNPVELAIKLREAKAVKMSLPYYWKDRL